MYGVCVCMCVCVCVYTTSVPEVSGSRLAEGSGVSIPQHLMYV